MIRVSGRSTSMTISKRRWSCWTTGAAGTEAMSTAPASSTTARRIWLVLGCLIVGYFLFRVRDTLPPFLIAFAAAALLDPLLDRLQRRGWSRGAAAGVVFAVFL